MAYWQRLFEEEKAKGDEAAAAKNKAKKCVAVRCRSGSVRS